jgi:hypothetical protein
VTKVTTDHLKDIILTCNNKELSPKYGRLRIDIELRQLRTALRELDTRIPHQARSNQTSTLASRGGVGNGSGYPREFKAQVVAAAMAPKANRSQVARDFEINPRTVWRWCVKAYPQFADHDDTEFAKLLYAIDQEDKEAV